jgi:hypothetical protein
MWEFCAIGLPNKQKKGQLSIYPGPWFLLGVGHLCERLGALSSPWDELQALALCGMQPALRMADPINERSYIHKRRISFLFLV